MKSSSSRLVVRHAKNQHRIRRSGYCFPRRSLLLLGQHVAGLPERLLTPWQQQPERQQPELQSSPHHHHHQQQQQLRWSSTNMMTAITSSNSNSSHTTGAGVTVNNNNNNNNNSTTNHTNNNYTPIIPGGPAGSLFQKKSRTTTTRKQDWLNSNDEEDSLIGAKGYIERTFGSNDNALGLLTTGGSGLAAYASFDPHYGRAKQWIINHPVGNSVVSPIFITGLTGALTEAAFPQAVVTGQSIRQQQPLLVGVTVQAAIEVVRVTPTSSSNTSTTAGVDPATTTTTTTMPMTAASQSHGFHIHLKTQVTRVRDDAIIAEGTQDLWVPDYQNM